jgi:glycosyltransferase involved in cell wall biosynthesis
MKICFIGFADSIHTRRWVEYFCNNPENEVHLLTLIPPSQPIEGAVIHRLAGRMFNQLPSKEAIPERLLPLAKSALNSMYCYPLLNPLICAFRSERIWWELLPFRILRCKNKAKAIIEKISPDLVHGLSLPYGGGVGGLIGYRPLVISLWGTDFVYFAQKYPMYRWLTRKALSQTDLLLPDNTRDKYLAELYGFSPANPSYVVPATGGLKLNELPLYRKDNSARGKLGIDPDTNLLTSIRGFKTFHVNTETLIEAIPQIVTEFPNSLFVIDGAYQSSGYFRLKKLAKRLKVESYIRFTNRLSRQELADYLSASDIMVSVTVYEGLPISMLEGMAYGVIPCMSNHSPIQEWVTDGWNGYLFNPRDPENIGQVIIKALKNKDNFQLMRQRNWDILKERADYYKNMKVVEEMYCALVKRNFG